VILASDGVFDEMSSEEAVAVVAAHLATPAARLGLGRVVVLHDRSSTSYCHICYDIRCICF
jgi:hypothetical protein